MSELLKLALEAARALPPEKQDQLAGLILGLSQDEQEPVRLSPGLKASLARSLDQAARREFATDKEVAAVWRKHGV